MRRISTGAQPTWLLALVVVAGGCSFEGGAVPPDGDAGTSPVTCDPTDWPGVFMSADAALTTHAPVFRRSFYLDDVPASAPVHIIGLGDYQLHVNGERVTTALSNQPWSQYDRRLYWRDFDVAPYLHDGDNEITVLMGASWWYVGDVPAGVWQKGDAIPRFDPEHPFVLGVASEALALDAGWEWAPSPLVFTHVLGGEHYDATARSTDWQPARSMCAPVVTYEHYDGPLFTAHEIEEPLRIVERSPGITSYFFAQNSAAYLQFEVEGDAGQRVAFVPSEYASADGDVVQLNLHGNRAAYEYVLRGGGVERHEAQFFYHGFQFVRVEGAVPAGVANPNHLPAVHALRSVHVRLANRVIGSFTSSSVFYNDIHAIVDASLASNSSYVFTDCPQREKLGWLEQTSLLQRSLAYRYDIAQWYAKIARDIGDAQMPDGLVQTVAPDYRHGDIAHPATFSVEWGAAAVFVPWELYRAYGGLDELRRSYASMRAFVESIAARSPDFIAPGGLGDWYDWGHGRTPGYSVWTPYELSSTAMFAMSTRALIAAARALGETDDVTRYTVLFDHIQSAFWSRFFDPATGQLRHNGSPQTAHAMALEADLVPAANRAAFVDAIAADLEMRGYQQTTGEIGHAYLIRALGHAGRADVLHRVYSRQDGGSYGAMLARGLTTLSERWDGDPVGSNSLNHAMLGHVMEWFYGYVAGIRQADSSVAWSEIEIGPNPGPLASANATITVTRGKIAVSWSKSGRDLTLDVTIPPGPDARVIFPAGVIQQLSANGVAIPVAPERTVAAGRTVFVARYRR